ncbi:MAG TPA: serine hydrolase, partial [Chloroflexota bacterium]|nr:serine hydrolase [Chloroflexota bacterium]
MAAGSRHSPPEVDARLDEIARGCSGDWGFFAQDLRSGRTVERAPDSTFPTASLIKVAILVELERRALTGDLSMDQVVELR